MIYLYIKRFIDVLVSLVLLIFFSPLLLVFALLIFFTDYNNPFYTASRSGMKGLQFKMFKFRTMVPNADSLGGPSTALNDKRLTKIGRFLRKHKIDELPQLINVLFGQMSFVGPRPQVEYYTSKYTCELRKILNAPPGITDISSLYFSDMDLRLGSHDVDNYYETTIEPIKNKLRLYYSKNISFALDLKILIFTFLSVFSINLPISPFLCPPYLLSDD